MRKKLIFDLQSLSLNKENFERDCTETKLYLNSLVDFWLIQWNTGYKLKWQFGNNLYAKETKPIHLGKSLKTSYNQVQLLKKMESFKFISKNGIK
jgi:hypothetical protein